MDEAQTRCASKEEATLPVSPKRRDGGREEESEGDDEVDVPAVLPPDDCGLAQVADVGNTGLAAGLQQHPSDVGEPEASVRVVRVELGVCVAMVRTVTTRPPLDGAFDRAAPRDGKEVLQRLGRVVGPMGPEPMVAGRDT